MTGAVVSAMCIYNIFKIDIVLWYRSSFHSAGPIEGECTCCCSVTRSRPILCNPMDCSTPGFLFFAISQSLLKLMSIDSVMPSNHLILYCLFLLLTSLFPSIRAIRWPKYWSFSFIIIKSALISLNWIEKGIHGWERPVCAAFCTEICGGITFRSSDLQC